MSLPVARSYCHYKGGFLAKPRNEADRNSIRALLPSGNVRAWLGIYQQSDMTWVRDNQDSMGWTNWKSGEGNDRRGVTAGAAMVWQNGWSGEWYDMPNYDGRLHYVVCELSGSVEYRYYKLDIHTNHGAGFSCLDEWTLKDANDNEMIVASCDSSDAHGGHGCDKGFDDKTGGQSNNGGIPTHFCMTTVTGYIQYDAGAPFALAKYEIITEPNVGEIYTPRSWTVYGSNDVNNWVLDHREDIDGWVVGQAKTFYIPSPPSRRALASLEENFVESRLLENERKM